MVSTNYYYCFIALFFLLCSVFHHISSHILFIVPWSGKQLTVQLADSGQEAVLHNVEDTYPYVHTQVYWDDDNTISHL